VGHKLTVCGRVLALRWADGASGVLSGSLEGLYEAFRLGHDDRERSTFVLELAGGNLVVEVEVRDCGDAALPPRPDEHPFAGGRERVVPRRCGSGCSSRSPVGAPSGSVALTVQPEASSGLFAGARGGVELTVPNLWDAGALVVHTGSGSLWLDYLERHADGAGLETDLWVDGVRSSGRWHGADGKLRFALDLHRPNVARGWYEGTCTLRPDVRPDICSVLR
jgi:hypothetical protein